MKGKDLKIESRINTRWFITIFVLIWTILCLIMIGVLTYAFFTSPSRIDGFLILVLIFLMVSVFIASNYISWQLRGKETLTLNEKKMMFRNEYTFFKNRFDLDIELIDKIQVIDNDEFVSKFWGVSGGKIVIEYLGRNKRFGKDISIKEADKIANQLRSKLKTNTYKAYQ
ncbi:hypothetical protein NE848_10720 [Gramella jeungdoensis]|uniref:Uncharacterized protein n=1 Tax=Gramella jeungdoensis TaxID=708091 RepID=A0ABT0Z2A2_9FLAO|nr:hypothetical protein [Gramella jeungdoensis]MCM8569855.1 hypothetical protein [Gramella jeungdoensis]